MTEKKMIRYLCRQEHKAATAGVGLDSPLCLYAVIGICVATDAATCYASIESILVQNQFISLLLAGVAAVILDGISIPFVRALKRFMKTRKPLYKAEMAVSAAAFLLIYLLTVVVKICGARDLFHVADLSITGAAAEARAEVPLTGSQIAMVAFLAVLPLATTLFAACMCFYTVNTRIYRLKSQLHRIRLAAAVCESRITQYKQALDEPLELRDEEALKRQLACIQAALVEGKVDAYTKYVLSGAAATPEDLDLARDCAGKLVAGAASDPVPGPVPVGAETVQVDFSTAAGRQAT